MQELNYLISSSAKVSEQAKELSIMAVNLFNDLYENQIVNEQYTDNG